MVEAAERLIAERGLAAVSLRDVQLAAGQRNKSAANYHFGTRDGLIDAVLETRMGDINERRTAMVAELDAQGKGNDLRSLVEAWVMPLAETILSYPESAYARFLMQLVADPAAVQLTYKHLQAESFRDICERLIRVLDTVPETLRQVRIDRIVGLTIVTLANWEGAPGGRPRPPVEALIPDLVDACVALATAPVSRPTLEALGLRPQAGESR